MIIDNLPLTIFVAFVIFFALIWIVVFLLALFGYSSQLPGKER